jgi:hypothetical protein
MKILLGNTGLIGTTLKKSTSFDLEFNSSNIHEYTRKVPDGCDVYLACLPGTKWLVNQNILKDLNNISLIINSLATKSYKNIYLISTIDVYCNSPLKSDENTEPTINTLSYGTNRLMFEKMVENILNYDRLSIYRLPALFSKDIKKNVLYDLLNNNNVNLINANSIYQWYNLDYLYGDIIFNDEHNADSLNYIYNMFSQGVETKRIVNELFPEYSNIVSGKHVVNYDYCTNIDKSGYLYTAEESFDQIKEFVNEYRTKPTSI